MALENVLGKEVINLIEKKIDPKLWKPVGFKKVALPSEHIQWPPKKNSFLDCQAPEDRYEVRGIMPKAPTYPKRRKG